jgi:endonuclease YncB( thermonuclease family)
VARAYPARLEGPHVRGGKGGVVDGDTQIYKRLLSSDTKDWEITENGLWVRPLGVDTPETNRLETRASGLHFSAFAEDWLARRMGSWPLIMETELRDSFGRWLARIRDASTGESLSDALIAEGDRIGVDVRYPGGASAQLEEAREA